MKERDLGQIYTEARAAVGKQPDPSELIAWKNVLGGYKEQDVRSALVEWQNDTTPANDGTDRCKGETMPKATRLKAIIEARHRASMRSRGEFHACGLTIKDERYGELRCLNGALYRRTIHRETGNSHSLYIQDCECWNQWQSTRLVA